MWGFKGMDGCYTQGTYRDLNSEKMARSTTWHLPWTHRQAQTVQQSDRETPATMREFETGFSGFESANTGRLPASKNQTLVNIHTTQQSFAAVRKLLAVVPTLLFQG